MNLQKISKLPCSEIWAIIQFLREDADYWHQESQNEAVSKGDRDAALKIWGQRSDTVRDLEEIMGNAVFRVSGIRT